MKVIGHPGYDDDSQYPDDDDPRVERLQLKLAASEGDRLALTDALASAKDESARWEQRTYELARQVLVLESAIREAETEPAFPSRLSEAVTRLEEAVYLMGCGRANEPQWTQSLEQTIKDVLTLLHRAEKEEEEQKP